jgi:hypothetical protein
VERHEKFREHVRWTVSNADAEAMMKKVRVKWWTLKDDFKCPLVPVDDDWSWGMRGRLRQGTPLSKREWPKTPPVFVHKSKIMVDIPSPDRDIYIVSSRLRAFLEAEAPDAAEYYPVTLRGPGGMERHGEYWAMNFIRVFDCLDRDKSMNIRADGTPFVEMPVIDGSLIPPDGVLGLVKDFRVMRLVRNDLRLKIKKAGFTGVRFGEVAHSDGTNFKPFIKPDHRNT